MEEPTDDDPTCFVKMLTDFRTESIPGRRLSTFGYPGLGCDSDGKVRKPVKLSFDDSFLNDTVKIIKKRKNENESPVLKANDSYTVTSPWEARKMKADLVEARSEITRLESRIGQMETVHKETIVLFEQDKRSLQQSLDKERSNSGEIERRLHTLRKREVEMKQDLLDCQGSLRQDKIDLESKYHTVLQEQMLLKDKYSELQMESSNKVVELEGQVSAQEQRIQDIEEKLSANEELNTKLREELNQKRAELRDCELDKTKMSTMSQRVKELEYDKETHQEAMAMAQAQQSKIFRLIELEKEMNTLKDENVNLRQAITNKLYLEDVVADLRSRVAVLQERENEIVKLKVEVGVAETRLQGWTDLSKHILGVTGGTGSPIDIRQSFERLQKSELVMSSENSQLKLRVKTLEETQNELSTEKEALKSQILRQKLTIEQNDTLINRLRKQNTLIVWERNDLRNLVDSCQKEFMMTSTASLDLQHMNRIEALEKALDGYRRRHEELEGEPGVLGSGTVKSESGSVDVKLKTERDNLRMENERLSKKVEELEHQIEYRALKGDFNVRDTKILHFKANPTATATSSHKGEMEKMQEEIARLRERVKVLQEGSAQHDLTAVVDERVNINTVKEIEDLKKELSTQGRQNQRLREAFKKTSHEFREAINMLLGYKVDALPNMKYRLLNVYADSPDQQLFFKLQDETMCLLETPFSNSLEDLIDVHLHQDHSIPLFLSAVTMKLFQKPMICRSVANEDDGEIIVSD